MDMCAKPDSTSTLVDSSSSSPTPSSSNSTKGIKSKRRDFGGSRQCQHWTAHKRFHREGSSARTRQRRLTSADKRRCWYSRYEKMCRESSVGRSYQTMSLELWGVKRKRRTPIMSSCSSGAIFRCSLARLEMGSDDNNLYASSEAEWRIVTPCSFNQFFGSPSLSWSEAFCTQTSWPGNLHDVGLSSSSVYPSSVWNMLS